MKQALTAAVLSWLLVISLPVAAGQFWQDDWATPDRAETQRLLLRPLTAADSERMFHSYMGSQAWLYERLGWSWPTDKSSLEQNQSMVNFHLRQAKEKSAFTYLVIDKQEELVIGAVYFVPVADQRGSSGIINQNSYNAEVTWWLNEPAVNASLHNDLFALLTDWLRSGWPWSQVLFPVAESNQPARAVLENSAARQVGHNRDTEEYFYSYSVARK